MHFTTVSARSTFSHDAAQRLARSFADLMSDQLSELDWQELTALITTATPERIKLAVSRVTPSRTLAASLHTAAERLLHLAAISSGKAFDRALLGELRRLNLH